MIQCVVQVNIRSDFIKNNFTYYSNYSKILVLNFHVAFSLPLSDNARLEL